VRSLVETIAFHCSVKFGSMEAEAFNSVAAIEKTIAFTALITSRFSQLARITICFKHSKQAGA
jgi:hypothetical protein